MLFNSFHFLIYFPTVLVLYFLTPSRFRWALLLAASYYFYMAWRPVYALLLLGATVVSYAAAILIDGTADKARKRTYLTACLVTLLGVLFVYKYFNFFNDSFRAIFEALGLPYLVPALHLALPIGISFFTFQKIAYVVDVYDGKLQPERHFGLFAVFSSFFPQLVAGPIERAGHLMPQFRETHDFDYQRVADGLKLMTWGFFKKVVVADRLAPFVGRVYGAPQEYEGLSLVLATVFFAFQVYCDFSAYSDIALGAAQTLGFRLTDNFRRPYFATSIPEFWKRWHISLSTWLTDYVYTPLTRSKMPLKWYHKFLASLFLTFLVSGLWHGAAWTFVVWGALHGTFLVMSMLTRNLRTKIVSSLRLERTPRLLTGLRMAMTFTLVCLTYVFFRAASVSDALYIVTHAFSGWGHLLANATSVDTLKEVLLVGGHTPEYLLAVGGIATVLLADAIRGDRTIPELLSARAPVLRWSTYYALVASIVLLGAFYDDAQQFIYFQF